MIKGYHKYREFILYIFFGGCTTIVNMFIYYVGTRALNLGTVASTLLAWWISVGFAYVSNRIFVFRSHNKAFRAILLEFTFFVVCRLLTGILDILVMYLFVDRFGWNDLLMKFISNLMIILANYLASKWLIFQKHTHGRQA